MMPIINRICMQHNDPPRNQIPSAAHRKTRTSDPAPAAFTTPTGQPQLITVKGIANLLEDLLQHVSNPVYKHI